jgi:DNA-binding Lrp family transcriptional regulator
MGPDGVPIGNSFKFREVLLHWYPMKPKSKDTPGLLSEDETLVIKALHKNSKDSLQSLAKSCGFSQQKVQRIIKRLENEGIIWGYTSVTDEKRQGRLRYIVLIKRSMNKVDKEIVKKIANLSYNEEYEKQEILIEDGFYLHGEYDWMIIFTAKSLRDAKKFSSVLLEKYPNLIAKVTLMHAMFSTKNHHIKNPNPEALFEFL